MLLFYLLYHKLELFKTLKFAEDIIFLRILFKKKKKNCFLLALPPSFKKVLLKTLRDAICLKKTNTKHLSACVALISYLAHILTMLHLA